MTSSTGILSDSYTGGAERMFEIAAERALQVSFTYSREWERPIREERLLTVHTLW